MKIKLKRMICCALTAIVLLGLNIQVTYSAEADIENVDKFYEASVTATQVVKIRKGQFNNWANLDPTKSVYTIKAVVETANGKTYVIIDDKSGTGGTKHVDSNSLTTTIGSGIAVDCSTAKTSVILSLNSGKDVTITGTNIVMAEVESGLTDLVIWGTTIKDGSPESGTKFTFTLKETDGHQILNEIATEINNAITVIPLQLTKQEVIKCNGATPCTPQINSDGEWLVDYNIADSEMGLDGYNPEYLVSTLNGDLWLVIDDVHGHADTKGIYIGDQLYSVVQTKGNSLRSLTIRFYATEDTVNAAGTGVFAVNLGQIPIKDIMGKTISVAGSGGSSPCKLSRFTWTFEEKNVVVTAEETVSKDRVIANANETYTYTLTISASSSDGGKTGTITVNDTLPKNVTYNNDVIIKKVWSDGTETILQYVEGYPTSDMYYGMEINSKTNTISWKYLGYVEGHDDQSGLADGEQYVITYSVTVDPDAKANTVLTDNKEVFCTGGAAIATKDVNVVEYIIIFKNSSGTELYRQNIMSESDKQIYLLQPIKENAVSGISYTPDNTLYFKGWAYSNSVNSDKDNLTMNYYAPDSFKSIVNAELGTTSEYYYFTETQYDNFNDGIISDAKAQAVGLKDGRKAIRFIAVIGGDFIPDTTQTDEHGEPSISKNESYTEAGFVITDKYITPTIEAGYQYCTENNIYKKVLAHKTADDQGVYLETDSLGFSNGVGIVYTNLIIMDGNENKTYYATPYIKRDDGSYVYGHTRAVSYSELNTLDAGDNPQAR